MTSWHVYEGGSRKNYTLAYDSENDLTGAEATGESGGQGDYPPESYNYDSTSGNLSSKAGVSYTYGDQNHKHAVTALSNGNTYSYDANGNMTYRHVYESGSFKSYPLSYDAENHLTTVSGDATASFGYNGDGQRITSTEGGVTTAYIGNYFEWNVTTQTKRTYYYAGASRIAMRENGAEPQWILGDYTGFAGAGLGSTSKMVSYAGAPASPVQAPTGEQWYKAWGETRLQTGTIPTKYQYTGQYNQAAIGLY